MAGTRRNSRRAACLAQPDEPSAHPDDCRASNCCLRANQGRRVFIKDMAYYFFPPDGSQPPIAASFGGGQQPGNPTVMPLETLKRFHFTFLIRHPRRSIPSYYRCTIPPLVEKTAYTPFMPCEAGYKELAQLFDFLVREGIVDKGRVTVVDADDLLDHPEEMIRQFCDRTGIDFDPGMLVWDEADGEHAAKLFAKWNGWHDDVLDSTRLNGRSHAQVRRLRHNGRGVRRDVLTCCCRKRQPLSPRTRSGQTSTAPRRRSSSARSLTITFPTTSTSSSFACVSTTNDPRTDKTLMWRLRQASCTMTDERIAPCVPYVTRIQARARMSSLSIQPRRVYRCSHSSDDSS